MMAMVSAAAVAASDIYVPYTLALTLEAEGIHEEHLQQLLDNTQVMHGLHYLDQVRRNISANADINVADLAARIQHAQYALIRRIHVAWEDFPELQQRLENPSTQHALVDALRCTQP
jgi:hypothetical protein